MVPMLEAGFWKHKSLDDLNQEEWEALCDGCGRCCLLKIEDIDTGELFYTNVICRYYDNGKACCTHYQERTQLVPDCLKVTAEMARREKWLPDTCAYRLLAESRPLFDWHPLVSGNRDSLNATDIPVRDKVISEQYVHPDELPEHLAHWLT